MTASQTETALQKQQLLFTELSGRLIDTILNRMFNLRPEKAIGRSRYLFVLFLISGFIISLPYYPLSKWAEHIGSVFSSLLSTTSTLPQVTATLSNFIFFLRDVILDERILQYLPVFLAPFFIALQSAAIYLADVFELDDVSAARRFIGSVALSGSDETIRIKNGRIDEESAKSPAYLIGGPGKVMVELDSVALFERADGTPHVIGPTGKEPSGKATLEGFERLRHMLDIRDHHVELRDQNDDSKAVKSRSRDGIPVKATDVHVVFSVFRGDHPVPSNEQPYPFSEKAIKQIVYKAASKVTPEKLNPSTYTFSWINNMVGLIRSQLGGFMSKHNLTEYLASIGIPEVEKVKQREETIFKEMQDLTQSVEGLERNEIKPPPSFQERSKIRNLFAQFADEFTGKARDKGVELHWIGVGTWESILKIVPDKHMKAWLLTQENLKNDTDEAMERIRQAVVVEKMMELIQKVPLDAYYAIITGSKDIKHIHNVKALLLDYRKQLQEIVDFIESLNKTVPENIQKAIKYIDNQIGYWVGRSYDDPGS